MGNVENAKVLDAFRMLIRQSPGDDRAPVVSHYIDLLILQRLDQTKDIFDQFFDAIILDSFRLIAQVITALVRDNDSASCLRKGGYLMNPTAPIFREAMQQQNR